MAEQDNDQERTEQPTEKKLREAREEGNVPRSRDLSAALVTLACFGTVLAMHRSMAAGFDRIMHVGLDVDRRDLFRADAMSHALATAGLEALKLLAPVFAAGLLATFLAPILLGGFNVSLKALQPKAERLNPLEGLKKLVSIRGLVELAKSLLKVVVIGSVLAMVLWDARGDLMQASRVDIRAGIGGALAVVGHAGLLFAGALGLVGLVDAAWQRFDYMKRMRMTHQEQRDEHKETEGNPELKGRVRSMQQQMAQRRMMTDVPDADVVVTNPTHFAVALKYDEGSNGAPRVVAKGLDEVALRIRAVAAENGVPTAEVPPLARALYHTTKIGREIPSELYVAVAQVLAYVYRLQHAHSVGEPTPEPPQPDVDPSLMGPYRNR